ncbi:unnamed protein product [Adineta steineri]|uniref:C-type lectin domain-containing protein n=1 Tax=Adineta steineri TaxID=433720 RepID=A0A813PNG1_9BILA|nr:unnamed protein product [Adineta steineri]CAF3484224.1 unnamed protein product [Adineta steineri]
MSSLSNENANTNRGRVQSMVISKLIDDPQMKEMIVMEYERLTPLQLLRRLKFRAQKQGNCLIPNWLSLVLCNLFLVLLFGLMAAAIMLAKSPPENLGKENTVTAAPLQSNLGYNATCFTWDTSCNEKMNLWCIMGNCDCYNQLYYWNASSSKCVQCPTAFYYNGSTCICPSPRYLQGPSNTTCALYRTYNQTCSSINLCNPTPGLYCSSSGICICSYGYYWNLTTTVGNGYCVSYASNTETCSTTIKCLPTSSTGLLTYLTCTNGTCQCPTTGKWYWTGDICTQINSYSGSCITNQQCDGTLQLICNGSICICAGGTAYGTWFWNGTMCILCPTGWINYGLYCYYNSQLPATQPVARTYCQKYGGDLLYIQDQTEFDFIQPHAAAIIGAYKLAFVGYYTINNTRPGLFEWYNDGYQFTSVKSAYNWWCTAGTPYGLQPTFSYQSTATPQIQACGAVQIYGSSLVCMNDWWCSASLPFICKISQ